MPISEVYNEDCMIGMKHFPDKFFDLAVVDPQTGQGEGKRHNSRPHTCLQKNGTKLNIKKTHSLKDWDEHPPQQTYFDELFRISKHQIIMCENYLHFEQKEKSAGRIIWNLLRDNDFSACQIMWTSLFNKIDYFEFLWSGMIQGFAINNRQQQGNKKLNQKRIHPTEKPISVYYELLKRYSKPEFKIIDTHLGSQSHRIAAYKLGFDFWGWEIDKDYYEQGNERFKKAIAEPLFDNIETFEQQKLFK